MSSTMTLDEFIQRADAAIVKRFEQTGCIRPTYHFVTGADEELILPAPPFDKDTAVTLIRSAFARMGVKRCLYVDEAWVVTAKGEEDNKKTTDYAKHNSLEFHPGRIEIIMYSAEDSQEGFLMARRQIIREDGKPPRLGKLKITRYGRTEGRMVGLLPRVGSVQ